MRLELSKQLHRQEREKKQEASIPNPFRFAAVIDAFYEHNENEQPSETPSNVDREVELDTGVMEASSKTLF